MAVTFFLLLLLRNYLITSYLPHKIFLFICLTFRFDSVILLRMNIDPKQRMERWKNLKEPKPSWETFKRIGMFGLARWRKNFKKNLDANNK